MNYADMYIILTLFFPQLENTLPIVCIIYENRLKKPPIHTIDQITQFFFFSIDTQQYYFSNAS